MALQNKFIVFNKESDYASGFFDQCSVDATGALVQETPFKLATYISPPVDSLTLDTWWSKITLNLDQPEDVFLKVSVCASNSLLGDVLYDTAYSLEEKMIFLSEDRRVVEIHFDRGLLNRLKGRYLWFVVAFKSNTRQLAVIEDIKIEFPVDSFIRYFPAIYSKNIDTQDFFFRFVSIFQDLYMAIEERIDNKHLEFDPQTATNDDLKHLIDFINFQEIGVLEKNQARHLLAAFDDIMKLKGTSLGIQRLTKLLLNKECRLVESYKIFSGVRDKNTLERLEKDYCNDRYHFTIQIFDCRKISQEQKKCYVRIMDAFVPAKTRYKVIFDVEEIETPVEISSDTSQIPMKL
ncbi:MAG: hypothetical protein JXO44_05935 [Clostridia bacterium]|nr:hypothetical protein [Clostridia bacterium]